ncbi:uncharacterized protein CC84DRAFT_638599 [Paraphaeosphaeria sporulosa]|uniref:BTB domain-containing protein n=1 Tax=Paraphaeosphaeria sporulosa TaxID=1460663 RepID=A0A177CK07_9PLEO|nr:uncharacterized protein CC84DRAFT_638599 [Paraphaeosphaeria sporulosa]OAG07170.1 hypothetical protein CC84DRAFT_638599 [Paraphaeosphaeria sporulosa]
MTGLYNSEKQLGEVNTVKIKVVQEVHDADKDDIDKRIVMEKTFTVSKENITAASSFFTATFNGSFDGCIELHDTDIKTFEEFLVWLEERGGKEKPRVSDAQSQSDYAELGPNTANIAVKLYVFAHIYEVPRLRDDATDRLYSYFLLCDRASGEFCITPKSVELLCEHTHDYSGIRDLLAAGYHERYHPVSRPLAEQDLKMCSAEFLADVLESEIDGHASLHGTLCTYHGNEGGTSWRV